MSVNIGLVGLASVGSGNNSVVSAPSGANIANSAVRVFDMTLIGGGPVSLYAGTNTAASGLIATLNATLPNIHSTVGYRFANGVYAFGGTGAGNVATVTYMLEF
jgi:hypothetical protein